MDTLLSLEEREPLEDGIQGPGTDLRLLVTLGAFAIIVLAAFGLRIYHLGGQSLWYDEGFSVYLSVQNLTSITSRTAADIHPPFYYYLLHFWIKLAGTSEFATRFPSLLCSVATIPLLWRMAADLSPLAGKPAWHAGHASLWPWRSSLWRAGAIAAVLAALSPTYVWYAQEARMYSMVVFLSALLVWIFLRMIRPGALTDRRNLFGHGLAFFVVGAVAAYTHFYALFVVAFIAFSTLIWWSGSLRTRLPTGLTFLTATLAIGMAYLPWAGYTLNRLTEDTSYYQGALDIVDALKQTALLFSVGHSLDGSAATWAAAGVVGVFALSLIWLATRGGAFSSILLLSYPAIPTLLLFVITYGRPKFHPRYLLLVSPAMFLVIALWLAGAWPSPRQAARWLGNWIDKLVAILAPGVRVLAACFLVVVFVTAVWSLFTDVRFARDDWRAVAEYIDAHAGSEDTIILISGHAFPVFTYYYHKDNWTPLPEGYTLSVQNTLGYNIANTLNRVLEGHDRLWVVRWQADVVDPNDFLDTLLSNQARRLTVGRLFQGIDLQYWEVPAGAHFAAEPQIGQRVEVNYENKVKILGFDATETQAEAGGLPVIEGRSGGTVPLTIYWQALANLDRDYSLSLRIKDEAGHFWGRLDHRPTNYFYPTTRWKPGEIIFGRYELPVLPGTPPGDYTVEAELYSTTGGKSSGLNVLGLRDTPQGTSAPLARLHLSAPANPPSSKDLQMAKSMNARFGDLQLIGYEPAPDQLSQGASADVTLFWQALRQPDQDLQLLLRLVAQGQAYDEIRLPPLGDGYPTSRWVEGDRWRGQLRFTIPADAPPGESQLQVAIGSSDKLIGEPITIQKIRIAERSRQTQVPANIQHPLRATLGNSITFLGYDIGATNLKPGDKLKLTLYWQAQGTIGRSYTVFVHLLDGTSHIWGQRDSIPAGGAAPTTGWVKDEVTVDAYEIVVDKDAPSGTMQLEIGMYDPTTGQRLKVDGKDDRILLEQVLVQAK